MFLIATDAPFLPHPKSILDVMKTCLRHILDSYDCYDAQCLSNDYDTSNQNLVNYHYAVAITQHRRLVISSCGFNYLCIFAYASSNTAQFYRYAVLETNENELDHNGLLSTYKKQKQLHNN